MSTRAIVKSVLSGDTVIVRPKEAPAKGQPAKERILHLAGVTSPRLGSASRDDEPWAYPAREFLRTQLVGKEVAFNVVHSLPSGGEFATILSAPPAPGQPPQDVGTMVVGAGWGKARDNSSEALKDAEAKAQAEGKGQWATEGETQRTVSFQMPADPHAFIAEHKDKDLDAIVEQVRDGTQLRVRLILDDSNHQFINLVVAGAKSPRASMIRDGQSSGAEPWGDEAKFFTEVRLLQRPIKVRLLSAPVSLNAASGPTPDGSLPAPSTGASFIIGQALHPNGNIADFLTAAGLAKVIDWHAGILAAHGGLDKLRAAERAAREKRAGLWEVYASTKPSNGAGAAAPGAAAPTTKGQSFDATVVRIWGPDQLSIVAKGDESGKERRVQLASVRGPRGADAKNSYWAAEAKEFLRKRLVGKTVHVFIDYVKPKDGEYEERECVTIKYGAQKTNVAEQLIEKGLATVLRHRRDDEDRSAEFDKLIVAEQTATSEARGVHSTKEVTQQRIVDASENANRAAQYLPSLKRQGKLPAVVDFVSSGHRFKLLVPKEHAKLTFVLAGIKAPRTARSANEKGEPYGAEAHAFANKFMQRDVEVSFDSTDKQGGFIGAMYANGQNVAVELVRAGLASVHEYSAQSLSFSSELLAAEEEAKTARKNIWSDYSDDQAAAAVTEDPSSALPPQYLDVFVSAVRESDPFCFSVQILEDKNVAALERLMSDLALSNRNVSNAAPAGFTPRTGDIVSAKWSEDNQWYRAKVKKSSAVKKEALVVLMDYGNEEAMPFSRIRPLDAKFKSLPGQAQDARLSFVKLPPKDSEYGPDARRRFAHFTEGRKLVANIDQREGNLLHLRLIDPTDPNAVHDPLACINADLVRDGLATLDKSCRYIGAYPQVVKKVDQATEGAKADRLGMFELGDVSED